MKGRVLLFLLKEKFKDPRLIIALIVLTLALLGSPVLATDDDPKLPPGAPNPSPDPTP